jgi:hypothetical protein
MDNGEGACARAAPFAGDDLENTGSMHAGRSEADGH